MLAVLTYRDCYLCPPLVFLHKYVGKDYNLLDINFRRGWLLFVAVC